VAADRAAGHDGGVELAVAHQRGAADEDVAHAVGGLARVVVGGVLGDGIGVEGDDVGVAAGLEAALSSGVGCRRLDDLGGHQGHPPDGLGQGEDPALADLPAQMGDLVVVDPPVVAHFHRLGIPVHVWTVDDEDEMRALLAIGVDGIVTDRPDVLARVLGR